MFDIIVKIENIRMNILNLLLREVYDNFLRYVLFYPEKEYTVKYMVISDSLICNIKCRQVLMSTSLFLYTDNNCIINIVFYDIFEYAKILFTGRYFTKPAK